MIVYMQMISTRSAPSRAVFRKHLSHVIGRHANCVGHSGPGVRGEFENH